MATKSSHALDKSTTAYVARQRCECNVPGNQLRCRQKQQKCE